VEKTLDYATRAWEIEKQLGRDDKAAIRQTQRAAALTVLERYDESEKALLEAIPVIEASGNYHSLGIAYNHPGDLSYVTGRNQEGADAYYKALDIFVRMHDIYNESHTRKGLRETLRGINPEEALLHGDRFEHLRDSIYDQETNRNLSHYAAQYDNDFLQQINHRQKVRYIWLIVLVIALFCLMSLVTWLIYQRQQKKQQQHFNNLLVEVEKLRSQSRARKNVEEAKKNITEEPSTDTDNVTTVTDEAGTNADSRLMLARVIELVSSGLPRGEFSIEHIAGALNMSVSTFRRRMLAATGDSPKNFILAIQMERATELLTKNPEMQIADIAMQCGFSDAGSFTRTFRRFYGVTPSQYREK
jgi:AraC-like DNA-binding protein